MHEVAEDRRNPGDERIEEGLTLFDPRSPCSDTARLVRLQVVAEAGDVKRRLHDPVTRENRADCVAVLQLERGLPVAARDEQERGRGAPFGSTKLNTAPSGVRSVRAV